MREIVGSRVRRHGARSVSLAAAAVGLAVAAPLAWVTELEGLFWAAFLGCLIAPVLALAMPGRRVAIDTQHLSRPARRTSFVSSLVLTATALVGMNAIVTGQSSGSRDKLMICGWTVGLIVWGLGAASVASLDWRPPRRATRMIVWLGAQAAVLLAVVAAGESGSA